MRRMGVMVCVAACAALGGCSDKLLRETVFANTESMIGVSVSQDPKTQLYELKAGFARHELFMVPTDKTVTYHADGNEVAVTSGADKTANVLGEIQVGGKSKGADNSVEIYQRLAVGDIAVRSSAAVALMANDAATAAAVSDSGESLRGALDALYKKHSGVEFKTITYFDAVTGANVTVPNAGTAKASFVVVRDGFSRSLGFVDYLSLYDYGGEKALGELRRKLEKELSNTANIK